MGFDATDDGFDRGLQGDVRFPGRAPRLAGGGEPFAGVSRESLLLTNNVLLVVACASVLLGTLYPLLRRLESQGLLDSEWREEDKRMKRFYRLSPLGASMFAALKKEWRAINASLDRIL